MMDREAALARAVGCVLCEMVGVVDCSEDLLINIETNEVDVETLW